MATLVVSSVSSAKRTAKPTINIDYEVRIKSATRTQIRLAIYVLLRVL